MTTIIHYLNTDNEELDCISYDLDVESAVKQFELDFIYPIIFIE